MLLNMSMLENPLMGCIIRLLWLRALLSTGTPVDCTKYSFTASFWSETPTTRHLRVRRSNTSRAFPPRAGDPLWIRQVPDRRWGNEETKPRSGNLWTKQGHVTISYFRKILVELTFGKRVVYLKNYLQKLRSRILYAFFENSSIFLIITSPASPPTTDPLILHTRVFYLKNCFKIVLSKQLFAETTFSHTLRVFWKLKHYFNDSFPCLPTHHRPSNFTYTRVLCAYDHGVRMMLFSDGGSKTPLFFIFVRNHTFLLRHRKRIVLLSVSSHSSKCVFMFTGPDRTLRAVNRHVLHENRSGRMVENYTLLTHALTHVRLIIIHLLRSIEWNRHVHILFSSSSYGRLLRSRCYGSFLMRRFARYVDIPISSARECMR